ncbi:bifunctional (p)ppGpp synthetase/guanosine-3',5'-bis(diphosphate) 3'-pyrophosphohydrolase, partial [Candidatus Dependentiae bacterium]|nr:bifunctional (p)ppGpp synthetase/guanosine-3',5'-bis(diphosphate) 3'-pyrophosphohydrolase [Candidatus Dependentiae bacterium]
MSISENATSLSQEADNSLEAQLARFYTTLTYLPKTQLPLIQKAFQIAKEAHEQQKRSSGEPYITHPLAVAQILADMHVDADTLCAAILHDVLEDTRLQKKLLIKEFNTDIADLVDGVSKLSQVEFSSKAEAQAENYRKMLLAMTRDIRVIIVKLADRLHNMRTLAGLSEAKKQRVSRETLEIYAPLANRLGMHNIRVELEELAFQAIYPLRYRILHDAVFKARGHRQEILHAIRQALREKLDEHHISASSVLGRQKHLFSIYEKMREKHLSFGEIMDIYGFRIVVPTRDDCYRVLGSVHNLFKPVPGKFKDYIAIPKSNGYQSLHTILFGPEGVPIEIQIRTAEMDNFAENGVAAHWLYKTHESHVSLAQMKINHWLKNLIEMQNTSGNSEDFIESVKIDLFPDEVYVFSPKGKILELPGGATPIDFAYAVHTDIGNHCIGARIDRRPAALSSKLYNGQTVEIITSPEATPKQAWLNIAVTGRARSAIKHFLKEKQYDVSIALGKQLVLNALLSLGETNPNLNTRRQNKILKHYTNYEHFERLLSAVGLGQEAPIDIAQTALGHLALSTGTPMPLVIKGTEGMVLKFAPCCYPLPGDTIVGVLVPNEGLWVHRDNCPHAQTHLPTIPLHWDTHPQKEFKATLMLDIENRQGVLARLTASVAEAHINIQDIRVMR